MPAICGVEGESRAVSVTGVECPGVSDCRLRWSRLHVAAR